MSEQPALLVERDGHVVTVTMNRPEARNALNPEMICRMADVWDMIDTDEDVRVAILTGSNGHFCAGADLDKLVSRSLKGLPPENDWEQRIRDDYQVIFRGLLRTSRTIKPLIAAIEGSCIAGGVEILQATDIRVAAPNASFALTEATRGVMAVNGGTQRILAQVPYAIGMEMMLTGKAIDAETALRHGFVNCIVPQEQLMATAIDYARRIAEFPPLHLQAAKEMMLRSRDMNLADGMRMEQFVSYLLSSTEDGKEGTKAFAEKRKPQYKGR